MFELQLDHDEIDLDLDHDGINRRNTSDGPVDTYRVLVRVGDVKSDLVWSTTCDFVVTFSG